MQRYVWIQDISDEKTSTTVAVLNINAAELSCSNDDQGLTSVTNQDSRQEDNYQGVMLEYKDMSGLKTFHAL